MTSSETGHAHTRELVRRGYEAVAEAYLEARPHTSPDISAIAQLQRRLPTQALVLDAGCGAGVPILQRLSARFHVVGVDFSMRQLSLAARFVPGASLVCQDLTHLGFAAEAFDAVCSYYAIIHIPREEHAAILEAFYRILKPGGLAFLCLGAEDLGDDTDDDYFGTAMYWSHYDAATNLELLRQSGFAVVWHDLIDDSLDGIDATGRHLFVLAEKEGSLSRRQSE